MAANALFVYGVRPNVDRVESASLAMRGVLWISFRSSRGKMEDRARTESNLFDAGLVLSVVTERNPTHSNACLWMVKLYPS